MCSKAFVREDDLDDDDDGAPEPISVAGEKNYITPGGFKKLREELHQLVDVERPKVTEVVSWAAGNGDRSENADYQYGKRRLREIDKRARFLNKRIQAAEVVDPLKLSGDQVFFGSTVRILFTETDEERTYSIVGVDEVDVSKGKISWKSPIGAALLKARVGDTITFRSPKGMQEVEILDIRYVAIIE